MATFPRTESLLNNYFLVAVAYILANLARLGVSVANKATMIACLDKWSNIYPLASTIATSNAVNVKDKNIAKAAMKAILRVIFGDFLTSILTTTDRLTLKIPVVGGPHANMPLPDSEPKGKADDSYRLAHKLSYLDGTSGKRGKPYGADGCEVYQKIGGVAPVMFSELTYLDTMTKSPLLIGYDGSLAGSKVWYWMRWVNKSGKGNWGKPFDGTILP